MRERIIDLVDKTREGGTLSRQNMPGRRTTNRDRRTSESPHMPNRTPVQIFRARDAPSDIFDGPGDVAEHPEGRKGRYSFMMSERNASWRSVGRCRSKHPYRVTSIR